MRKLTEIRSGAQIEHLWSFRRRLRITIMLPWMMDLIEKRRKTFAN